MFFDLFSQEALKSTEEEYYNFLSLTGYTERPTLGYKTLSDSFWTYPKIENSSLSHNIWSQISLSPMKTLWEASSKKTNWFLNGIKQGFYLKIYGPELFNSYNTEAPYGQNDGALWQGKGYNASLTTGIRLEGYGLEITFKPQICFSQNLEFDYVTPAYSGSTYTDKAAVYGYYGVKSLDAPQRFGDSPFWTYDWGDSEIRYTWHTFTLGFGTQTIWLGPANINPIMHSNNAASYPKVDIGLRKTELYMPYFGWYLGDIEARVWTGYLSESDYFDNDSSNDHNMINAMTISYSPPFLKQLTIGANRIFQTTWDWSNLRYLGELFFITIDNSKQVQNQENQIASIFASWLLPTAGFEVYAEIGIDDYVPGRLGYIRYPFHTMVYTAGLQKTFEISKEKSIGGRLLFEVSDLTMSQDFQFQWPYTFYAHSKVLQGYTNRGQWLGAGNGTGGNSQYIGLEVYYPKGKTLFYVHRSNPDNNYFYSKAVYDRAGVKDENGDTLESKYFANWKASLAFGIISKYFFLPDFEVTGGGVYNLILNPTYKSERWAVDKQLHNFSFDFSIKYTF